MEMITKAVKLISQKKQVSFEFFLIQNKITTGVLLIFNTHRFSEHKRTNISYWQPNERISCVSGSTLANVSVMPKENVFSISTFLVFSLIFKFLNKNIVDLKFLFSFMQK